MKVKLKKRKKSPAPIAAEQAKIESTIERLREKHSYEMPTHVIYNRGYKQTIDLANIIQKAEEEMPAPIAMEERMSIKTHKWFHRMNDEEMQETFRLRNREIIFECIQQLITITFYIIIAFLISILILKKLF